MKYTNRDHNAAPISLETQHGTTIQLKKTRVNRNKKQNEIKTKLTNNFLKRVKKRRKKHTHIFK